MTVMTYVKESPINYTTAGQDHRLFINEKENGKEYMKHDQLFKELIHNFFEEFLEAFFPDVHEHIDFQSIKPMSEEMFTDLLDGESRRADIIIEARLKGEETLIIIHVEPQSSHQRYFNQRMYLYYSLLYNKYRKPILPIAVFSYDEKRTTKNQFTIEFPFHKVLTFNFLKIELSNMNWREYLQSDNPVAAALLSKMGYNKDERIQVKKEFLRMMIKMELNPARARFINGFFEKYLILNQSEEEELMKEIKKSKEFEGFTELPLSTLAENLIKGMEKGREQGLEKGKKEVALEMIKEGSSTDFIAKVTHLEKNEIVKMRKNLKE